MGMDRKGREGIFTDNALLVPFWLQIFIPFPTCKIHSLHPEDTPIVLSNPTLTWKSRNLRPTSHLDEAPLDPQKSKQTSYFSPVTLTYNGGTGSETLPKHSHLNRD